MLRNLPSKDNIIISSNNNNASGLGGKLSRTSSSSLIVSNLSMSAQNGKPIETGSNGNFEIKIQQQQQ